MTLATASANETETTAWVAVPPDRSDIHGAVGAALGATIRIETSMTSGHLPSLIIVDIANGTDALAKALWSAPGVPVIAIVADEKAGAKALSRGASHVLVPPLDSPMVRLALRAAFAARPRPKTTHPPATSDDTKAIENRLHHSARLATIGEISAAVAHEINNPLQFMSVCLDELRLKLGKTMPGHQGADLRSLLDDALEGVDRIRSITVELLPFARSSPSEIEEVDVNKTLMRALRMMRNDLRHRAQLICNLEDVPNLHGDPRRLAQVFTNILLNASQAIEEGKADENLIRVDCRHVGQEIIITISDSGMGIPDDHLERVFERFFTTKPSGSGTGLGMSVSQEIISNHGGRIDIASSVARGTEVTIMLPVTTALQRRAISTEPPRDPGRSLRILAIDDDLLVLKAYRRSLGRHHNMTFASDGEDALAVLETEHDFDVILCDLMMPNMDGPRFFEALARHHPNFLDRIVFCSGGTFTPRAEQFVSDCDCPLVHKPIHSSELLKVLFETVDRADGLYRSVKPVHD